MGIQKSCLTESRLMIFGVSVTCIRFLVPDAETKHNLLAPCFDVSFLFVTEDFTE